MWTDQFKIILRHIFLKTETEPWTIISDHGLVTLHCTSCPKSFRLTNETKEKVIAHRKSHEKVIPFRVPKAPKAPEAPAPRRISLFTVRRKYG